MIKDILANLRRRAHLAYDQAADLDKVERWKNLYFMRDGRSALGEFVFTTRHKAELIAEKNMRAVQNEPDTVWCLAANHDTKYLGRDFSHVMQIPWNM